MTRRLTVNVGLRWDVYSPWSETQNRFSYLNTTAINPITGTPGALRFGGSGDPAIYCNCTKAVGTWYKNFGPRFGFAYSVDDKTVVRGGFSMSYTHGGGVGGRAGASSGPGQLGFTGGGAPSTLNAGITPAFYLDSTNSALPAYSFPSLTPSFATGFTSMTGFTGSPNTVTYVDPYLGKRAPYSENFNFGLQRELIKQLILSVDYAGSNGKFLSTGIGQPSIANQLDPQYFVLGGLLNSSATPANIAAAQAIVPSVKLPYASFSGSIGQALRPFPQYNGISDIWGNFGTSSYNSLQVQLTQKQRWGLNYGLAYTWAKTFDDVGGARTTYATNGVPARFLERSLSGSVDIPNHISFYGVYNSQFGRGSGNFFMRSLVRDWSLSTVIQHQAGLPLSITASGCVTPFSGTCMPSLNPNYTGSPRINGGWGRKARATGTNGIQYIDPAAFILTNSLPTSAQYVLGNAPRTYAYGLRNPGSYDEDLSLRRAFPIHDRLKFTFEASLFNVDNHVDPGGPNTNITTSVANTSPASATPGSFGTITSQANTSRRAQFSGRFDF